MKSRFCFTLTLFLFLLGGCDAVGENPAPYESGEEYHSFHALQADADDILQMGASLSESEPPPLPGSHEDPDTLGWGN